MPNGLGGGLTLAALAVPAERFDEVAALVNAHPEVAHNYQRDHALNMWFVLATERPEDIGRVLAEIAAETGLVVHDMPKLRGILRRPEVRGMSDRTAHRRP